MATRPVFAASQEAPFVNEHSIEFEYFPGFSHSQKHKSIRSLHLNYGTKFVGRSVLEISSKSSEELGIALSAFNLRVDSHGGERSVESLFQGSKVFEAGGPYTDLYDAQPLEAKRDLRLSNSGELVGFNFFGVEFPLEPLTFFYDWVYINALAKKAKLAKLAVDYDSFTDIEFNPKRSVNCQARAVARYVGLERAGVMGQALGDPGSYLKYVYGNSGEQTKKTAVQENSQPFLF